MNISLYYQDHSSDKVYNACITPVAGGYHVDFSYGRRGSSLTTGRKTSNPVSHDNAVAIFNKLVREKTAKGYKENGSASIAAIVDSKDSGVRPQLLNECSKKDVEKYLTDDNWCAQEKFDGENRLLFTHKTPYAANRKGFVIPISENYKEELLKMPYDMIFAGEDLGDKIILFDQIDEFSRDMAYEERIKILTFNLQDQFNSINNDIIVPIKTAWTTEEKQALYLELIERNAEGIVFKNIHAVYQPGRPNSGGDQLKFKFYETASCVVTGINTGKRSIQISLYDEKGELIDVGNATVYPNQNIPMVNTIVEIKYLYAYKGGSIYQPVLLSTRSDVDLLECTMAQLKYKPE